MLNVFKAKYKVSARSVGPEDFSGLSKFVERNRFPNVPHERSVKSLRKVDFFKKYLKLAMHFSPKVNKQIPSGSHYTNFWLLYTFKVGENGANAGQDHVWTPRFYCIKLIFKRCKF
jgi:hypothetical protein